MHRDRRIVLIAGEPGIGKTRVAHHFASAALAEHATVLAGRCSEEPLAPYEPFTEALAQADAAEAFRPSEASDVGARHRLFDAIDSGLTDLAAGAPLLVVIDDFQWADHGTLLLTSFLLRSTRPGPMLVLGTYRDTELGRHTPLTAAYRGGYCWILAGGGDVEQARSELDAVMSLPHAFDTNWLSLQAECAETAVLVGDRLHAATLYERLAPYAGRPATAGRAVTSYGAIDRHLGSLATVLGRQEDAIRHLENAIRINEALGCTIWRAHAQRNLSRIAAAGPRAT